MLVPLSWLKEYIDIEVDPTILGQRLTMSGIELGEIIVHGGWENCYVGRVISVSKHPNADRLNLCKVSTNEKEVEVVCGAPNVAAGQNICFAQIGATLHNPRTGNIETLKAAQIRGITSQGMICSELELGIGNSHEGIVVLPNDAPIGMPLDDYLGDTLLDLELTPNRSDCLSMLGVAHEVAAIFKLSVKEPSLQYEEFEPNISAVINAQVEDHDLCKRYTGNVITNINIGSSPEWMQDRLSKVGIRSINNIVDITNYVMLEYNQPLHAFDLDKIENGTIIVRRARLGETLETLDGINRTLTKDNLVIADSNKPIGLGGVIGGANSEIDENTTSIFLESATFDNYNNRATAESFQLRTEATLRFEKGLRPELAPIALRRASQLIHELAGGNVCTGSVDIQSTDLQLEPTIKLNLSKLNRILGMNIDSNTVLSVLESLGIKTSLVSTDEMFVIPPYWRNDLQIEEDLVEEVIRIIGYEEVPTIPLSTPIPHKIRIPSIDLRNTLRDSFASIGLQETISYPLITLDSLKQCVPLTDEQIPLEVANPMNSEQEYLRPSLRPSILQTLSYNQTHTDPDMPIRLFETGRVFIPRKPNLPLEKDMIVGVISGPLTPPSWITRNDNTDFYDLKGLVHAALLKTGITATYEAHTEMCFNESSCARILVGNVEIGVIGELSQTVINAFDIRSPNAIMFELDLNTILESQQTSKWEFNPLSRFPTAKRDLALMLPQHIPAESVIQELVKDKLVTNANIFDVYSGETLPSGMKSLGVHIYFQSSDRTLTNKDVDKALSTLLKAIEKDLQAVLRTT